MNYDDELLLSSSYDDDIIIRNQINDDIIIRNQIKMHIPFLLINVLLKLHAYINLSLYKQLCCGT